VHDGATYVYGYTGLAEKAYKTARSFVPSFVEPTVASLEDRVIATAAPVVAKAQDVSDKMLHVADQQVGADSTDSAVDFERSCCSH
jgi:hypothetical protein